MVATNPVKNILQSYLRRLTNLSGNNRSLLLLRLYAEQLTDLHEVNLLNGFPSFEVLKALIGGKTIKLCQVLDSRVEYNNEVSKKLKKIQRADNFLFEERGSYDLHIGWPFVRGKFSDGTLVRCPLLFFPVSIIQENNGWFLQLRQQAGITLNKSFLLAYSFYNKVSLDEEMFDTSFEDFNADSTVFRTQLYQLLKEKLEINFNPDNFRDELIPFQQFKKEEFDLKHRNGELKLFPEAVLGIFPQAGSQLVPDYLKLIEENSILDLEEFFMNKNILMGEETGVEKILANQILREEKLHTPFTLDAYQENAIKAVKVGQSIVVQGPPGTGKSQLICNLMADAIASGKRALLVCQKRAALDVVYNRMQEKHLGDFVGLVHDFRNERKMIFNKIARQIDSIEDFKSLNRSLDVIQMERRFFQVCRSIDRITEEFEEFRHTLFNDEECGLSVKELYLTSDLQGYTINIRQEYQHFPFTTLPQFLQTLRQYATYAFHFEHPDYVWLNRCSFSNYQLNDLKEIEQVIKEIPAYQKETQDKIKDLINVTLNLEDADSFRAREDDVLGMIALLKTEVIFKYMQAMVDEKDNETSFLWFTNVERVLMNCFTGAGAETFLHSDLLVKFQEALQKKMNARGNVFRLVRWALFSKDKQWLNDVLAANGLQKNKKGLRKLEERIDNRLNLEHHLTAVKKKPWLIELPIDYDEVKLKTWFTRQKLAIRAKLIFNTLREVKEGLHPKKYSRSAFIEVLTELLEIVGVLKSRKKHWLKYITTFQFRHLISDPAREADYLKSLRKDFESLCDFDRIRENLAVHEKDTINKLYDKVEEWKPVALEALFQNSLRLAWIEHIEAKNPDLRSVSSKKMEKQQEELIALVDEKQKLSHDILLLRARERVYDNLEYNRLNNRVTYRDLYHQVTKKKKIWPLRKLITDFQHEIFNVMPCWMVSPEATSAIFPMTEIFDLVIFDEASQCFAERGIPAMYRGRQIVVAGDDMQLKPNELYQTRWEEEDGDHPDLEVDSLLDLAKRYLPTVHLQGHYRSQSLELIDFSNKHFYEGRLQLLPDRNVLNRQQPAIEYQQVDGVWENNTNEAEAEAVVERVLNLLVADPQKHIGVVTFNSPQQNLVLDLLEERFAKEGMDLPQTLFVKNIENVQGDEKDIIIFSVGYAPDRKKKMNMQFGSLNMSGGENRLNVAVTRAREKIILICSIQPEQLHTDDLKNEGPRLLKKYLEFARDVDQRRFIPTVYANGKQQSSWYLNNQIKNWGEEKFPDFKFEVNRLPLADLHIRNDKASLGIVLTDDMHYFSSLSEKDFFAYMPALMAKKNWGYHYVFSRNLWQDKEKVEEDLLRFIGSKITET
ncbi:MAG: AAA domain-containing protein [Cyclobacteriaceae bacterium]